MFSRFPHSQIHFWCGFPSRPSLMAWEATAEMRLLPQHRLLFERDFISLQLQDSGSGKSMVFHGFPIEYHVFCPPLAGEIETCGGQNRGLNFTVIRKIVLSTKDVPYFFSQIHSEIHRNLRPTSLWCPAWVHLRDGSKFNSPVRKWMVERLNPQNRQSSAQNLATHNKFPGCRLDKLHWAIERRHSWWRPHLHSPGSLSDVMIQLIRKMSALNKSKKRLLNCGTLLFLEILRASYHSEKICNLAKAV